MVTGVYCIRNRINGKLYIGSAAQSFRKRWAYHRWELDVGRHYNRHLQSAWKKYGSRSFEFLVIERCPPEICVPREQFYLDLYQSFRPEHGYNLSPTAGSTIGVQFSDEAKAKISKAKKGKKLTEEHKAKIGASCKGNFHTEEAKAKISKTHTGMGHTEETKKKLRQLNLGKKASEETRKKLSLARMGNKNTLGYKHREESKRKIGDALRGKPRSEETKRRISESNRRYAEWKKAESTAKAAEPFVQRTLFDFGEDNVT